MKHLKKGRKFGRERNQRKALMKSMASSFFVLGRIKTTEAKAKELRPFVEKIITRAKAVSLADRRYFARFFSAAVLKKIIEHGKFFSERNGGYTRVVKLGPRRGDAARMALFELVK